MFEGAKDDVLDDCAFWGIDPALLGRGDDTGLWPEHQPALEAFFAVATQIRGLALGDGVLWQGLDYAAVHAGLRLARIRMTPALWADVQIIEAGAIAALNRR